MLDIEYIPGMCEDCKRFEEQDARLKVPDCNNPLLMTMACACATPACPRYKWHQEHTLLPRIKLQTEWAEHLEKGKAHRPNRSHEGNGVYQGPFAFTLTMSPQWGLTVGHMIKAAQKLMAQKSCKVTKYAWYLEYANPETLEHPHIHGMYETETRGRIEQKHFKRHWTDKWNENQKLGAGFVGGYHRPVRSDEGYNAYIKKQGGIGEQSDNL